MSVIAYTLTGNDIGKTKHPRGYSMPDYCINKEFGNLMDSPFYLQFVEEGHDVYQMLDYSYASPILEHEISEAGFSDMFGEFDLRPLFEHFRVMSYEDMGKKIPESNYVVVDLEYNYADDDCDLDITIAGVLARDFTTLIPVAVKMIKTEKS